MKRNMLLAGLVALGMALGIADVRAQQPIQQVNAVVPAQPLQSRIACVNLTKVLNDYKKWGGFKREMEETVKNFDKQLESKRGLLLQMQNDAAKVTDAAGRESLERKARDVQREMQDLNDEARKIMGKKQGDQLVILYREIEEAVQVYARTKQIELVFHISDAINPADLHNPNNVQRKMTMGASFPMYMAPGMDITNDIVTMLNTRYDRMMQQTPPAVPAGGGAPVGQPNR